MNIAQAQRIKQALLALEKLPALEARITELEKRLAALENKRTLSLKTPPK